MKSFHSKRAALSISHGRANTLSEQQQVFRAKVHFFKLVGHLVKMTSSMLFKETGHCHTEKRFLLDLIYTIYFGGRKGACQALYSGAILKCHI